MGLYSSGDVRAAAVLESITRCANKPKAFSGLYKFLNFVTFCLFVAAAIQLGRFVYVAAYLLPTSGWGAGLVWSKRGEEVYEDVAFSADDKLLLATTRNGVVRAWSRSTGREHGPANQGAAFHRPT